MRILAIALLCAPLAAGAALNWQCGITFDPRGPQPQEITGLSLHSQGGSADVTRERDGQEFTIRIRGRWASTPETCWLTATGTATNSVNPWKN